MLRAKVPKGGMQTKDLVETKNFTTTQASIRPKGEICSVMMHSRSNDGSSNASKEISNTIKEPKVDPRVEQKLQKYKQAPD
eukprot:11811574-Ditylum_brightwellii.AAC.1